MVALGLGVGACVVGGAVEFEGVGHGGLVNIGGRVNRLSGGS